MLFRNFKRHFCAGMILMAVCSLSALGQQETADVLGKVTDKTAALVVGAAVTVKNTETGAVRHVKTNRVGEFAVTALPIGHYSVEITMEGFASYVVYDVVLSQGDRVRADAMLSIGTSETIDVGSVEPELQTDSSTLGTVVTEREVEDLPLNGRNFMELAQVLAGTNEGPPSALNSGARPDDRRLTSSVSANGQDESLNNQLIDGLDNNERVIGTIGVRPSVDAIAEFRVQTNLYTAEVGRAAGAQINIITKAGTNKLHGTLYEFFRNDIFDATDYFAITHVKLRQNQYGASLGGPLLRNKVFFFGDYEGFRQVAGRTYTTTVPTLYEEQHIGDFSDIGKTSVPTAALDATGVQFFKLYPAPNKPGLTASNFVNSPTRTQNLQVGDGRADFNLAGGDHAFIRYTINESETSVPGTLPIVNGIAPGGNPFAYAGTSSQHAQNAQLNYLHAFTPNFFGELKVGYTRIDNGSYPLNYGKNLSAQFGIAGSNLGDPGTSALATVSPAGYASVGDGIFLPLRNLDNTYQGNAQATWIHGKQSIKFGAALIRRHASVQQSSYPAGYFQTNIHTTGGVTCGALACLLRGIIYIAQRSNQLNVPGLRTWEPSGFVQDDWRILPKLTLNIGVRYDVFTPFTESKNRLSNFDPYSGQLLVAGVNGVSATAGVNTDYSNLAPRVGFAYTPAPKTVLRGGFGMSFIPVTTGAKTALSNVPYTFNYASETDTTTFSTGLPIPRVQSYSDLTSPATPSFTLSGIDRNYRSSYIEQFNLTWQQQTRTTTITLSYVGEIGKHLRLNPNFNLVPPGLNACPPGTTTPSAACYKSVRPFAKLFPNLTAANVLISEGYSSYNALQAVLSHRFTRNFGLNANYTWAHGLNDVGNYAIGAASNGVLPAQTSTLDYGDSDLNIRSRFGMLLNYTLPTGKKFHGITKAALNGWQVNSTIILSGGLPFSVTDDTAYSNTGVTGGGERALLIGDPKVVSPAGCSTSKGVKYQRDLGTRDFWFNGCAFTHQVFGTYVPSRRNLIYGPGYHIVNASIFKTFPLFERAKLQFRAEGFNITNTPNFSQPDAGFGDGSFGQVTATRVASSPRQIQFALKILY